MTPLSNIPSCEGALHEASTRVQAIHPSGHSPRLRPPGWNGPPLGLSPELRTPPTRSRQRTSRWGQAIEHGPETTRSTSHQVDPPIGSPLKACDFASQRQRCASPGGRPSRRDGRPALSRLREPPMRLLAARSAVTCKRTWLSLDRRSSPARRRRGRFPVPTNLATPVRRSPSAGSRAESSTTTSDSTTVGRVVRVVEPEGADGSARSRSWRLPYGC